MRETYCREPSEFQLREPHRFLSQGSATQTPVKWAVETHLLPNYLF